MAKSPRALRRLKAREDAKLTKARVRLAELEVGGTPARPIEVSSASVVEPHAKSMPCAACGELTTRVEDHAAVTWTTPNGEERRLRGVRVSCGQCGFVRPIYFRLGTTEVN